MSLSRLALSAVSVGIACAGCEAPRALEECASKPVKGWNALLDDKSFAQLSHRRERVYDPLSEVSWLLWADSNYSYERLLTFDMAHPRFASGAPEERCIRAVSFMASTPVQGPQAESLAAFIAFLAAHGLPQALVKSVEAARAQGSEFKVLGNIAAAPVSAGIVVQGARGSFFRVEIGSAK